MDLSSFTAAVITICFFPSFLLPALHLCLSAALGEGRCVVQTLELALALGLVFGVL